MSTIIITGATGFVGRLLVATLQERAQPNDRLLAVTRDAAGRIDTGAVSWLGADLMRPEGYESSLRGAKCVVHLAAVTGKARPKAFQRGNVDNTRMLLTAAQRAGVEHFVYVSSIAAVFEDRRYYPYAASKLAAEALVQGSPLRTTIVRPTMVFGPGSPVQRSMEMLARLPIMPMFGSGLVRVQPVDVAELVQLLAALAAAAPAQDKTVLELGGPEVFSMKELFLRLRASRSGRFLHLPLQALRFVLGLLEPLLLPVLPVTAGQLASFANDSVAASHPMLDALLPQRRVAPCPQAPHTQAVAP